MSGRQGKTLQDFAPFTPAEDTLIKWLQAGNRKTCRISEGVPDSRSDDVTLRATFLRYLALGGCDACRLPETGLRVKGAYIPGIDKESEFTKGLDLEGTTLPHDLALMDCYIPDSIILRSAKVKNLLLNGAVVNAKIIADRLHADGSVILRRAKIAGEVRLLSAQIAGNLSCTRAELRAKAFSLSLENARVEGNVVLDHAEIAGEVRFLGTRLEGDLDCDSARLRASGHALSCDHMHANRSIFLCNAEIAGEVRLSGTHILGNLECDGADFRSKKRALVVEGAVIGGTFFLRDGFKIAGCLDMTNASIGSICDDPGSWPRELLLDRCRYGAFVGIAPTDAQSRLKWLALQQPKKYGQDFWPAPYEQCAKVLREMGHGADARTILIEKERLQRKARRDRLRRDGQTPFAILLAVSDWLMGITTRYGRQPLLAFAWLLFFWGFGALWFDEAYKRGEIKPNLPQVQLSEAWHGCAETGARREPEHTHQPACFAVQPEGASYPRFNAFFYSADTLFPVVSLEMQSYWIPDDTQPFGKWARGYLWFHIAMGWALTLLAVAGFSGLIKTDNTT